MRVILIIATILLFYNCSSKNQTELESSIDSSSVVVDSSKFDGGFAALGSQSRNIIYDSVSSMYCEHKKLSGDFNVNVYLNRYSSTAENHDSCTVKLLLIDKTGKVSFDSIQLYSHFYYGSIFKDCKNVMSYSTKFNIEKKIVDNNYGDIIVADFNFDNKDDIALVNDIGGNGGVFYSYYIQNKDRKFIKDVYLTDSMTYFPSRINKNSKTLITYVHAGVCGLGEHIYTFDINKNCWKEESHKIIDICQ